MNNGEFYTHSKKHAKSMKLNILNEVSKSLCKIYIEIINSRGTGFFLLINVSKEEKLYMLVTVFHVIKTIKNKNDIKIIIDNGNKEFNINMKRHKGIIVYDDEKDIIGIEIKEEDNIKNNVKFLNYEFLNYDINCKENQENQENQYKNYLGKDVFILHHPLFRDLECNSGKILTFTEDVQYYEFHHNLDTDEGSSGAPILLFENNNEGPKVIGVHKCFPTGQIEYKSNIGNFIGILIETVINELKKKNNNNNNHKPWKDDSNNLK